jgi:hypothetical protein
MITMVVVILVTLVFPIDIKHKHSKNLPMVINDEPGISISLNLHDTRIRHKLNNLVGLLKELKLYMNDHMKILKSCIYLKIKMAVTAGSCWFD